MNTFARHARATVGGFASEFDHGLHSAILDWHPRGRAVELIFARKMRAEAMESARRSSRNLAGQAINSAYHAAFHSGRCAALAAMAMAKAA